MILIIQRAIITYMGFLKVDFLEAEKIMAVSKGEIWGMLVSQHIVPLVANVILVYGPRMDTI